MDAQPAGKSPATAPQRAAVALGDVSRLPAPSTLRELLSRCEQANERADAVTAFRAELERIEKRGSKATALQHKQWQDRLRWQMKAFLGIEATQATVASSRWHREGGI